MCGVWETPIWWHSKRLQKCENIHTFHVVRDMTACRGGVTKNFHWSSVHIIMWIMRKKLSLASEPESELKSDMWVVFNSEQKKRLLSRLLTQCLFRYWRSGRRLVVCTHVKEQPSLRGLFICTYVHDHNFAFDLVVGEWATFIMTWIFAFLVP